MTAPRGRGGPTRGQGVSAGARGAIIVGLAVILGIVGLQILDDSGPSSGDASVTTTAASTPSTGSGTTTIPLRTPNEVKVKVYNASGVQGRAQTLTDSLRAKGFNMQEPANLNTQRAGTVVECTKGLEREASVIANSAVGNGATVQPYPKDPPAGASDADCIVIIGTA